MSDETPDDRDLFVQALALSAAERAQFLDRVCGDDAPRRGRLAALLEAHERGWSLLEDPTLELPEEAAGLATVVVDGSPRDFPETSPEGRPESERYRPQGEVARGGMGAVYRVEDRSLSRTVAMKVLLSAEDPRDEEHLLLRFLEEARVTAQLDHPGVVPVHESGVDAEGRAFFTMRLVEGHDARSQVFELASRGARRLERRPRRPAHARASVCEAVAYAHSQVASCTAI